MPEKIFQIFYTSVATSHFNEDEDIDKILNSARDFNDQKSISGMLFYGGSRFMQLLEGHEDVVKSLLGKIACDPRHHNINVIFTQTVPVRIFENWSMGFKKLESDDDSWLEQIIPLDLTFKRALDGEVIPNQEVLNLFKHARFNFPKAQDKKFSA